MPLAAPVVGHIPGRILDHAHTHPVLRRPEMARSPARRAMLAVDQCARMIGGLNSGPVGRAEGYVRYSHVQRDKPCLTIQSWIIWAMASELRSIISMCELPRTPVVGRSMRVTSVPCLRNASS